MNKKIRINTLKTLISINSSLHTFDHNTIVKLYIEISFRNDYAIFINNLRSKSLSNIYNEEDVFKTILKYSSYRKKNTQRMLTLSDIVNICYSNNSKYLLFNILLLLKLLRINRFPSIMITPNIIYFLDSKSEFLNYIRTSFRKAKLLSAVKPIYQLYELRQRVSYIIRKYSIDGIQEIHIYGSYASKKNTEYSDLDLLIFSKRGHDNKIPIKKIQYLLKLSLKLPIDIKLFTSFDYKSRRKKIFQSHSTTKNIN